MACDNACRGVGAKSPGGFQTAASKKIQTRSRAPGRGGVQCGEDFYWPLIVMGGDLLVVGQPSDVVEGVAGG